MRRNETYTKVKCQDIYLYQMLSIKEKTEITFFDSRDA